MQGLACRDTTDPIMENQMEKTMERELDTGTLQGLWRELPMLKLNSPQIIEASEGFDCTMSL